MFIRGIFLISFALFIDFLQLALGWVAFGVGVGLQAITPVGGAGAGAVVGAYACFSSTGGVLQGIADAAKCAAAGGIFGAALSAFGMPIGFALGILFDITLSITLGSGLIFLLMLSGMFYPKYAWSGGIFEMMPGFDALPGWTLMVILSLLKKRGSESKGGVVTATAKLASTAGGVSFKSPVSTMRGISTVRNTIQSNTQPANDNSRIPLGLKSPRMTDVTPKQRPRNANDNQPYVQKTA